MKRQHREVAMTAVLIALAGIVEVAQYLIYRDANTIFIWLINSIAFIPIQVLFVSLVIERLLRIKEKEEMRAKLNMIVGVFFSEVGKELLHGLIVHDPEPQETRARLLFSTTWPERQFMETASRFRARESQMDARRAHMETLEEMLARKRPFLVRLMENDSLLEHELFTDLLWAVFHLAEELSARRSLQGLPESDLDHLSHDMRRVYNLLIAEWLQYLAHLKRHYPYLFSLAVRTNPFDEHATVEVR